MKVIGYCRVSTSEQGDSGAGLEAQESAIRERVEQRGWELIDIRTDIASGKSMRKRDNLGWTLRDMASGQADVLMAAKLDRVSRSVLDFATLMETARNEGWSIAVLDLDVDTTSSMGELVANIMISLAQLERRVIGDRTRDALKAVRARGTHLGRQSNIDSETLRLIRILRDSGKSYQGIADALIREGVPTAQGGQWHPATVRKIYVKTPAI